MGEIRVQEKHGMGVWPWIIGLLIVAAVIWMLVGMNDNDLAGEAGSTTEVVEPVTEPANQ